MFAQKLQPFIFFVIFFIEFVFNEIDFHQSVEVVLAVVSLEEKHVVLHVANNFHLVKHVVLHVETTEK